MSRTIAKIANSPVQPLSSAAEGGSAPSRTLSTVAAAASTAGSNSATTYHPGGIRQRTIRPKEAEESSLSLC